jgi:hypothetical protein
VGRTQYATELGKKQSGIFFAKGLDRFWRAKVICPSGRRAKANDGDIVPVYRHFHEGF